MSELLRYHRVSEGNLGKNIHVVRSCRPSYHLGGRAWLPVLCRHFYSLACLSYVGLTPGVRILSPGSTSWPQAASVLGSGSSHKVFSFFLKILKILSQCPHPPQCKPFWDLPSISSALFVCLRRTSFVLCIVFFIFVNIFLMPTPPPRSFSFFFFVSHFFPPSLSLFYYLRRSSAG